MPVGFVCLATAVIDEFIQYFSPGRSAEVRDVLLDFSGAFLGVLMVMLIISLIKFIRR
jgi:VanZ family protein